jgi:hypothetical protein
MGNIYLSFCLLKLFWDIKTEIIQKNPQTFIIFTATEPA